MKRRNTYKSFRIASLINRYMQDELNEEQIKELFSWVESSKENRKLFEELLSEPYIKLAVEKLKQADTAAALERMQEKIVGSSKENFAESSKLKTVSRFTPKQILFAAAVLLLLFSIGGWPWWTNKPSEQISGVEKRPGRFRNDVAPGTNKAILSLSDGSQIVLDSAYNGTLSVQGYAKVLKTGSGQLSYTLAVDPRLSMDKSPLLLNTVSTPRGGQYQLTMTDGTRVWLNAASSLRFPAWFSNTERKVELRGEAYFEVAHDPSKPFRVEVNGMEIEVTGTHFNVEAYDDENSIKTTLLQGAVTVNKNYKTLLLKPGEQALLNKHGVISLAKNPDITEVVAWKNGIFHFNVTGIEAIMGQVARWYDVDIVYETRIPDSFVAEIPRDVPVSELLNLLELTGLVHFKIEGKKITVMK
jgi:transmembrane sensor